MQMPQQYGFQQPMGYGGLDMTGMGMGMGATQPYDAAVLGLELQGWLGT